MPNDQTPLRSLKQSELHASLGHAEALGRELGIDHVTIKVGKGKNASVGDWHKSIKITEGAALAFGKVVEALREPKTEMTTYEEVGAIVEQLEGLLHCYETVVEDAEARGDAEDVKTDGDRLLGLKVAIYALKTGWHV